MASKKALAPRRTPYESCAAGQLAKGCRLCVQGKKLVLFVTGLCSRQCYFCPISDQKKNKDVVYANERPVKGFSQIVEEAESCDAKGAGITGGDPLVRIDRTVDYIRRLKKRFGKDFHIHLYTPLENVDRKTLLRLYRAGLDEIRFHPDLDDSRLWERIGLAEDLDWDVGIEIPVIPDKRKEILELIDYVKGKVKFVNLNELELSDTNASSLVERGFRAKDEISYGVKGSGRLALQVLEKCGRIGIRAHYCTATLKDRFQLARRIRRRAKNVAQKSDKVTAEGILVRGAIYLDEMVPGVGYHRKLREADSKRITRALATLRKSVIREHNVPEDMIYVDRKKLRLLTSCAVARKIAQKTERRCAIVEEYPTWDGFEVSIEFL